ncbi:MAG TPA: Holliday junction branch migration DNA helicase RuvB [Actinomycetota bacterium]|nr:Holliday junction branch migration DNA helicase RuvB [Ardenticatenia bacterium]HQZ85434.1 Holliday junction branch migration DNA helicase RuvB [Actinomycetota bacterium]
MPIERKRPPKVDGQPVKADTVERDGDLAPQRQPGDVAEPSLRPRSLAEYIGQDRLRMNLVMMIAAARAREEPLDHVLFYGPPGLGKTTLSFIIAQEMGVKIKTTSGPAVERAGDLAAILTNLGPGDVLFIDEVHRLRSDVEEVLYSAMEDFALDIVVGKGPAARSIRLSLPRFTIVGATTRPAMLTAPLRDRFGAVHRLDFYDTAAMLQIVSRGAGVLGVHIAPEGAAAIASRARGTPRVALRLLRRVRDFAEVHGDGAIDAAVASDALQLLEIDALGLDELDRRVLLTLIDKFEGGPVGLDTIAASLAEDSGTIEDVVEPYLLQLGFLERTPRGRIATRRAYEHLGRTFTLRAEVAASRQSSLFDGQ